MGAERRSFMAAAVRHGWHTDANTPNIVEFTYGRTRVIITFGDDTCGGTAVRGEHIIGDTTDTPEFMAHDHILLWLRTLPQVERDSQYSTVAPPVTLAMQNSLARAKRRVDSFGEPAMALVSPTVRAALILAEVLREIAREEEPDNPMVALARYAVGNCHA